MTTKNQEKVKLYGLLNRGNKMKIFYKIYTIFNDKSN